VTVYESLCAKVWDWRRVLAYSAQLHDICIDTNACNSHWDFWFEETSSSISIDSSSSRSYTAIQWVLPETVPTYIQAFSSRGTLINGSWLMMNYILIMALFTAYFVDLANKQNFELHAN
jgi:hypothetical protein